MAGEKSSSTTSLPTIFASFLKLGVTAFGGPAMVAYIEKTVVEKKKWLSKSTFGDGVALCQMIPGATAMQTAAYAGLKIRGIAGAASSFIGFGLPAFFIMLLLSWLYVRAHTMPAAIALFNGLQVVIVSIVANSAVSFGKSYLSSWKSIVIALSAALLFGFGISPFIVIALAAFAGFVLHRREAPPCPDSGAAGSTHSLKSLPLITTAIILTLAILFFINPALFDLALLMIRVDLFAFGGGFASIPLLLSEVVNGRHWMDSATFMNGIALGQVTPGPIIITSTFIGYVLHRVPGSIIATISILLPSFLMVVCLEPLFHKMRCSPHFNKAVKGSLSSFVGLLVFVTIRFATQIPWDIPRFILAAAAFIALRFRIEMIWIVIASMVASLLLPQFR